MKPYQVEWSRLAEMDLAHFWLMEDVRTQVDQASREADQILTTKPDHPRAQVREGLWMLDVTPLRFCYEIDDTQRLVKVVGLALLKPR